ncbi:MAG: NifB/NifX family molybdenum-iron cluster-binding protein [Geothermobacteraceae bacterium]
MKVAISSCGPTPDCLIDERLGRAYWLLIYSFEDDTWDAVDNSGNRAAACNAGLRTAETLVEMGVTHVLTGEVGPKAFRILRNAGVRLFLGASGTAAGALLGWQRGEIAEAPAPNQSGSPFCLTGRSTEETKKSIKLG